MNITTFALLAIDRPEEARKVLEMVGRKLLEDNPSEFEFLSGTLEYPAWVATAKRLAREQGQVSMIKCIRENTGLGLKDSKMLSDIYMRGSTGIERNVDTDKYVGYFQDGMQ